MKKFFISRRHFLKALPLSILATLSFKGASAASLPIKVTVSKKSASTLTFSISATLSGKFYLEYGTTATQVTSKSSISTVTAGKAKVIQLNGLQPNSTIYYRVR